MPNHLSILGIIHTAISIIALLVAFNALYRDGQLDPSNGRGKLYIWLTVITCVTAFPIMKTGHLTPGHYVAIIIIVLLPIGIYAGRIFGKLGDYIQVIVMSTTLFLSCIPAIVETLTRLPISHPIAADPNNPIIQKGLGALMLLYVVGVVYQVVKLRAKRKLIYGA
ncbi:MAG TPA: hypothetical protein VFE54_10660 [Mucilaginibacter sp.]|jgi:hypothetical protein|nr:hypothetical protein [Mucilaginibacter sp.]